MKKYATVRIKKQEFFGMVLNGGLLLILLAFLIGLGPLSSPAEASNWPGATQAELTATGGLAGDCFGYPVSLDGDTAVVGASSVSSNTGAAYVFTRSGTTWTQQAKLTATGGLADDYFGWSVSISGDTAVVGAEGVSSNTGAAYVFIRTGTIWTQQAELTATGGLSGDYFGYSVSLSGDTAVVGASGVSFTGAAYVFTRSGATWTQQATLTATGGLAGDEFGSSVSIDGDTAVVGAEGPYHTGAAYVFTRSGTIWTQQAKLTSIGGANGDYFGMSVSLSGDTAIIGAWGVSSYTGAAYVFTRSGTIWTQQAKLTATGGLAGDGFGCSVSLRGDTAVVGAPNVSSYKGAAYVFTRSGTIWTQQAKLTAAGGLADDYFGYSVSISGDTAVVGAPGISFSVGVPGISSYAGAAYVFDGSGSVPPTPSVPASSNLSIGLMAGIFAGVMVLFALRRRRAHNKLW